MLTVTRPSLEMRFRRVPGARYYAWPVYLDARDGTLCYEAEAWYMVSIPRAEEGVVRFVDYDDHDEALAQMIADRIGVER